MSVCEWCEKNEVGVTLHTGVGVCADCEPVCDECGYAVGGEPYTAYNDGYIVCEDCQPYCIDCGEQVHPDDVIAIDGHNYCSDCAREYHCEDCGDYGEIAFEVPGYGNICISCAEDYHYCVSCDVPVYYMDVRIDQYGDTYCENCYEDEHEEPNWRIAVKGDTRDRYNKYNVGLELETELEVPIPAEAGTDSSISFGREYRTQPLEPLTACAVIYYAMPYARADSTHGTHVNVSRANRDTHRQLGISARYAEKLWYALGGYRGLGRETGEGSIYALPLYDDNGAPIARRGKYTSVYVQYDRAEVRAYPGITREYPPALGVLWIAATLAPLERELPFPGRAPLTRILDLWGWRRFGAWVGLPYNPRRAPTITLMIDGVRHTFKMPSETELLAALDFALKEYGKLAA